MARMTFKSLLLLVLTGALVIGVVLTGGCAGQETATLNQETPTQIIEDITPAQAFDLIQDNQNNPDFVIIDVRTSEEFTEGQIENATNLDFYAKIFRDELDNLDKNKTYLIYCRSGARSGKALNIMAELRFEEVYNMSGGIIGWKAEGLPTVK